MYICVCIVIFQGSEILASVSKNNPPENSYMFM